MSEDPFPSSTDSEWWRRFGNPEDFPVGSRVETKRCGSDFRFFRAGHRGTVIRNKIGYLSVIVEFDKPIHHFQEDEPTGLTEWNFHPEHLILVRHGKRRGDS